MGDGFDLRKVTGPPTATDNAVCRYDLATGKIIQNSVVIADDAGNISGVDSITISPTTAKAVQINSYGINAGETGEVRFVELSPGTVYAGIKAPDVYGAGGNHVYTLPIGLPTTNRILQSNPSGVLSWILQTVSSGDVVGPASATDEALVRFDTTTGKLIQNSGVILGDTDIMTFTSGSNVITIDPVAGEITLTDGVTTYAYTDHAGIAVPTNTAAFHATSAPNAQLQFNSGPNRYAFTDTAGVEIYSLAVGTALITLTDGVDTERLQPGLGLRVVTDKPAFTAFSFSSAGLWFQSTPGPRFQFRDTSGVDVIALRLNGSIEFIEMGSAPTARAGYGCIFTTPLNKLVFQDGAGANHQLLNLDDDEDITGQYSFANAGGLELLPHGGAAGNTTELRFLELVGGGINYVGFKAGDAIAGNVIWTLPLADGASGEVLSTNGAGVLSWSSAGSGDVVGPGSATDNAIVRFDLTTGKIIQNSGVLIDDSDNVSGANTLRIGTATDTATAGDFVSGLTAAARVFYDQSAATLYTYNSLGNIVNQLSSAAAIRTTFNVSSEDRDFEIKGDTKANVFYVDAANNRVGILESAPSANLEIAHAGNINTMVVKITQDNDTPTGLVIGNTAFSGTATDGLRAKVANSGQCQISHYGTSSSLVLDSAGTIRFEINGAGLSLFGGTPVAKPSITGSRGGNAALASLLTQGATVGYWTDNTTA